MRSHAIPVLLLSVREKEAIINTTDRFIRLSDSGIETLDYTDFSGHQGFQTGPLTEATASLKIKGAVKPFGLTRRNGEVVEWPIPTGAPGFGFWNVTKHCQRIGRRYITKTDD